MGLERGKRRAICLSTFERGEDWNYGNMNFMESRCRINPAMTMEMIIMNGVRFLENATQEYICRRYLEIYATCKCWNFIILNRSLLVFILRKRRIQLHSFIFNKKKKAK